MKQPQRELKLRDAQDRSKIQRNSVWVMLPTGERFEYEGGELRKYLREWDHEALASPLVRLGSEAT